MNRMDECEDGEKNLLIYRSVRCSARSRAHRRLANLSTNIRALTRRYENNVLGVYLPSDIWFSSMQIFQVILGRRLSCTLAEFRPDFLLSKGEKYVLSR